MGPTSVSLLALLAAFALLVPQSFADEHVVTLGAKTLDAEIGKNDFTLVEFYAPWCGHCKKLTPEYEAAAKQLKDLGSEAVLAKVDVDNEENKPLAARFGVKGFPTLKIFRKGSAEPEDYNGPREQAGIVTEVLRQSGPASVELASAEQAEQFFGKNKVAVVGVFSTYDSPEYEAFTKSAAKLRASYSFAHTLDATLLPKQDTEIAVPGARLFKDFDGPYLDAPGFDAEALEPFLESKTVPLVVEMSKDPANRDLLSKVFQSPKSKVLLFYNYAATDVKESLDNEFRAAAEKYSEYSFVFGDATENSHATEYFGVKETELPAIILQDQEQEKKFIKENIQPSDIPKFFEDLKAGLIEPRVKSAEIPDKNDDHVKVVVAKQFNEIVFSGKNVLIEFYAPWCGHCKKLAPILDNLGEKFKDDADVIIAKMDATANDVTDKAFDVKGFPTIYFVNAQGKVVLYESGRSKKEFVAYINKHKTGVASNTSLEEKAEEAELAAKVEESREVVPDPETVTKDEL